MHQLTSNLNQLKGFGKMLNSRLNDRQQPCVSCNTLSWACVTSLKPWAYWGATTLIAALIIFSSSSAWAYKVEKVCTDVAATAADLAKKTCKIVRVDPNKESAPKEEKKEEKKHGGH